MTTKKPPKPAPAPKGFENWAEWLGKPKKREASPLPSSTAVVDLAKPAVQEPAEMRAHESQSPQQPLDVDGYDAWFQGATGYLPRPWQRTLVEDPAPRSRVIRIPTGYGKTLGVIGAWLYHRVARSDDRWPRRLVWALPMRVLAEQTADEVGKCLDRLGLRWDPRAEHRGKVGVHLLMGGADAGGEWNLYPEEAAILVGTQDMLLSRALNRGYAAGRARWPMEFGLLNHDALWVLDEVQLMDVGLATTAQLQAFFDEDASSIARPRLSWWMSATLQHDWLKSVDTTPRHGDWTTAPIHLEVAERDSGLAAIKKSLELEALDVSDSKVFAALCVRAHNALAAGDHGKITLVVCNTVTRACETYDALQALKPSAELELVHSRFRPYERVKWKARFLERAACKPGVDRIIVATQVVEAGVDISAGCVISELAPWSSLVQRFGRCARYGGAGRVLVVDRGEQASAPYAPEEIEAARAALVRLVHASADAGIASIEAFEENMTREERAELYPYEPEHLLIRRELDELFDTTPDLTGADIDISRFIRTGEERDVSVFWVDMPKPKAKEWPEPPPTRRPTREELCNIPFLAAQTWLCGKATGTDPKRKLRGGVRAWVWDFVDGKWRQAARQDIVPGRVICVASDVGGYTTTRGFAPESDESVNPVVLDLPEDVQSADDLEDSELLSQAERYKTIATHNREVGAESERITVALNLPDRLRQLIALAGRWHDYGKAHPAFQGLMKPEGRPDRRDLAKAPKEGWGRVYRASAGDIRPGFRHELASCLALFEVLRHYQPEHPALLGPWLQVLSLSGQEAEVTPVADPSSASDLERQVLGCTADEFDLLAYLVLCHHGKVRVALHASPKDQDYVDRDHRGLPIRGVREGDEIPEVELEPDVPVRRLRLTLAPATLGLSSVTGRSWRERTNSLLRRYGPGRLAWLETLLIAADRRASKLVNTDPLLAEGAPQ
ncbi:MAG: CRISPR-associated helicase Cas3' [Polyangiaceae bacterium]